METKRDKDGLLSAEDAATYAEMEQKVQNYSAEIARMEEMESMEAELNKPVNTPITGKPMNGVGGQEKKTGRASNEYKEAMLHAIRNNFRNIRNVLSEGIDADGGYLVPEEYDSRLIEGLEEENIFRKLGTTITTSGNVRLILPVQNLQQHGSMRAKSLLLVMQNSARSIWTPISSMWR